MDLINTFFAYVLQQFSLASESSFQTVYVAAVNGGWMILFYFFFHIGFELLHDREQGMFAGHIEFIHLAINKLHRSKVIYNF
ncbi:MAG: hypothetical protein NT003_01180 [Candidatus Magasanikbacteria bacterium]|nr:hypothetical protein [Candidatus Magasanikbacteria bacterium]